MKKGLIYSLIACSFALLLVGCGPKDKVSSSNNSNNSETIKLSNEEVFNVLKCSRMASKNYDGDLSFSKVETESALLHVYDKDGSELKDEAFNEVFSSIGITYSKDPIETRNVKKVGSYSSLSNSLLVKDYELKEGSYQEKTDYEYYYTKDDVSLKFATYESYGNMLYYDTYVSKDHIKKEAIPNIDSVIQVDNYKNLELFVASFKTQMEAFVKKELTPVISVSKNEALYQFNIGVKVNNAQIYAEVIEELTIDYTVYFDDNFIYKIVSNESLSSPKKDLYGKGYDSYNTVYNKIVYDFKKSINPSISLNENDKYHIEHPVPVSSNSSYYFIVPQLGKTYSESGEILKDPVKEHESITSIPNVVVSYYSDPNFEHPVNLNSLKIQSYHLKIYVKLTPKNGYALVARLIGDEFYAFYDDVKVIKISDTPKYTLTKTWEDSLRDELKGVNFKGAKINNKKISLDEVSEITLENQKSYLVYYYYSDEI